MLLQTVFLLLVTLELAFGANILFFFALSTYSHRIAVWPLVEKLASKGHNITFVQPFKPKKPNPLVTEFFPEDAAKKMIAEFDAVDFLNYRLKYGHEGLSELVKSLPDKMVLFCDEFLGYPETTEWLQRSKYDLVVIDGLMNECAFGIAQKYKAKTIIFGTTHPFAWHYDPFGMTMENSWLPEMHEPDIYPLTLLQKANSVFGTLASYYGKIWFYYPKLDVIFRKHFQDEDFPPVQQLERETRLLLVNSHFSEEYARSFAPFVVPVGGMYCTDSNQTLPKDLEEFINASGTEGFVYVSFGSAANVANAPKEFQKIFHDVMRDSKLRFVWKYDGERPKELSSNVYTSSWLPQPAILAHPKIKAFVTHGGLLGTHEAVWNGVPVVAIPVFAEQDYNGMRIHAAQRGIMLDVNKLTYEKFADALQKVSKDPKYKLNMQRTSKLFRDRPTSPVDTAIWWTEYVLRHDESSLNSLKPLGAHQTWYERRLLDVWAAIGLALILVISLVFFIIFKIFKSLCCAHSKILESGVSKKRN